MPLPDVPTGPQPDADASGRAARLAATPGLQRQLGFLLEIDRLKTVLRQTLLLDGSRRENDAEHSWHLAMMALVLAEHAAGPLDLGRTLQLLLVHDVVEIDAGDAFAYDEAARRAKPAREAAAAARLFGLLPSADGARLHALWAEFEARRTPEARFAASLDRLQPLLHNFCTAGASWKAHGVTRAQVLAWNRPSVDAAPALWELTLRLIDEAVARGYLAAD